jgi:hypothetical protein
MGSAGPRGSLQKEKAMSTRIQVTNTSGEVLIDGYTRDLRLRNTSRSALQGVTISEDGVVIMFNTAAEPDLTPTLHEIDTAWNVNKILAIKAFRIRTGAGLRESKEAVEVGMTRIYGKPSRND